MNQFMNNNPIIFGLLVVFLILGIVEVVEYFIDYKREK
jgi:hypothetical protein